MKHVGLGATELMVSSICLGAMSYGDPNWRDWVLGEQKSRPLIKRALELGINFFDTAEIYSDGRSEEILGSALREYARRSEIVIATKVGNAALEAGTGTLNRRTISAAIDGSLKRLQVDYIDLYQIHSWAAVTSVEETLDALSEIVRSGKARFVGACNIDAWQITQSLIASERGGWARLASIQNHYNLLDREDERDLLPLCIAQGLGVIPWSPLARGVLAGTYSPKRGPTTKRASSDQRIIDLYRDCDYPIVEQVGQVASQHGVSSAQVAISWGLTRPGLTAPIIGATKASHLEEAVAAVSLTLSATECATLEGLYKSRTEREGV